MTGKAKFGFPPENESKKAAEDTPSGIEGTGSSATTGESTTDQAGDASDAMSLDDEGGVSDVESEGSSSTGDKPSEESIGTGRKANEYAFSNPRGEKDLPALEEKEGLPSGKESYAPDDETASEMESKDGDGTEKTSPETDGSISSEATTDSETRDENEKTQSDAKEKDPETNVTETNKDDKTTGSGQGKKARRAKGKGSQRKGGDKDQGDGHDEKFKLQKYFKIIQGYDPGADDISKGTRLTLIVRFKREGRFYKGKIEVSVDEPPEKQEDGSVRSVMALDKEWIHQKAGIYMEKGSKITLITTKK